jgi:hypothetical protein
LSDNHEGLSLCRLFGILEKRRKEVLQVTGERRG